ncbi:hypothetical protein N9Z63_00885 [bacterium]|nr:hypothetical protein [Mariniblastus sp.]MDB4374519.1 hypothetical protein [bacterium]MDB4473216.1 hypothetical protein [bacterium]
MAPSDLLNSYDSPAKTISTRPFRFQSYAIDNRTIGPDLRIVADAVTQSKRRSEYKSKWWETIHATRDYSDNITNLTTKIKTRSRRFSQVQPTVKCPILTPSPFRNESS